MCGYHGRYGDPESCFFILLSVRFRTTDLFAMNHQTVDLVYLRRSRRTFFDFHGQNGEFVEFWFAQNSRSVDQLVGQQSCLAAKPNVRFSNTIGYKNTLKNTFKANSQTRL